MFTHLAAWPFEFPPSVPTCALQRRDGPTLVIHRVNYRRRREEGAEGATTADRVAEGLQFECGGDASAAGRRVKSNALVSVNHRWSAAQSGAASSQGDIFLQSLPPAQSPACARALKATRGAV